MPHAVNSLKRSSNYSHCPLKKRPLKYDPTEDILSDSDQSCKGLSPSPMDLSEPENLSTKPEDLKITGKEKSSSLSPPPISLVAGRVDISQSYSHLQNVQSSRLIEESKYLPSEAHYGGVLSQHVKSLGGGPLESISLNPPALTSWKKINPYVPLNFSSSPRSAFEMFNSTTTGPQNSRPPVPSQFSSHYTPQTGCRDAGSPPHVSPPLLQEPAYPVLRIKEPHRLSSPSHLSTPFKDEPRVSSRLSGYSSPNEEPHYPPQSHQHQHQYYNSHHYEKDHYEQKESYPVHTSPSHSPTSRDSILSLVKGESYTTVSRPSPTGVQILPTNVNGSVRYQCPDCNKSYSTFSGLSKHLQFHCASQNKKSFICKFCEKVYVSLGALKMHIRTHTLPCKCNMCGKAFSRPWLLQGHIRTHTGEKPFSCQHCNRAFADRSNLRAHLQTHSEVKKYSCKSCSKTFSRMSLLVKHEEGGCTASPSLME